jgi:flagellar basal body-associated protein FliL
MPTPSSNLLESLTQSIYYSATLTLNWNDDRASIEIVKSCPRLKSATFELLA